MNTLKILFKSYQTTYRTRIKPRQFLATSTINDRQITSSCPVRLGVEAHAHDEAARAGPTRSSPSSHGHGPIGPASWRQWQGRRHARVALRGLRVVDAVPRSVETCPRTRAPSTRSAAARGGTCTGRPRWRRPRACAAPTDRARTARARAAPAHQGKHGGPAARTG